MTFAARNAKWIATAVVLVAILITALLLVRSFATTATGMLAKQLCSLVYVSRFPADDARALYLDPVLGVVSNYLHHELTEQPIGLKATGLGGNAQAIYRAGYGCTLIHKDHSVFAVTEIETINQQHDGVDATKRAKFFDATALETAITKAFKESSSSTPNKTLAIAIRYQGVLIAEGYAPGITPQTPLPGGSLSNSATVTLAGYLAHQGKITTQDKDLFPAWAGNDNRAKISLDNLLRMSSGIDIKDSGNSLDAISQMLYEQPNAGAWAAARGLQDNPGTHRQYSRGNTALAAYYLTQQAGGPDTMYQQIRRLFDTLGMHSAVLEPDTAGTFLGTSSMLASARDWSRLGQLYLQDGVWLDERLLPPEWVDYVTTKTITDSATKPLPAYGAGFWLASATQEAATPTPTLPSDTFYARGVHNQALYIVPSSRLVVVRLGATGDDSQSSEWRLIADVLAAMKQRDVTRSRTAHAGPD